MARPKKGSKNISATEKIENAFWKILESEDYSSVTIRRLTGETGLNRNTIYYHYENVDDVAQKAFEHAINEKSVKEFMGYLLHDSNSEDIDMSFLANTKKIHLLAKSESPFLHKLVKNSIVDVWIKTFQIDKAAMTDFDWINLNFISAGVITMLSNEQFLENANTFQFFPRL